MTKESKQFLVDFELLYTSGKRMEAIELMRDLYKNYLGKNPELANCLLEIKLLSDNWKSENTVEAYYINGYANFYLDEYDEALVNARAAIKIKPHFEYAFNLAGSIHGTLSEYNKAIEYFTKVIEINPNSAVGYTGLAGCYYFLNKYPSSIKYYKKAIQLNPDFYRAYYGLGNIHYQKKEYRKAIEYYSKTIQLHSTHYNAYYNRANTYKANNDYLKAIKDYEQYILLTAYKPDSLTTWAKDNIEELKKKLENSEYEDVEKLVSQIKDILKFKKHCITHYTGISIASKLIINDNKFRLSEGSFLNDTSEGRKLFDFLQWQVKPKSDDETIAQTYTEKPFIGSFVADHEHNNLTLWRMYGKEQQAEAKGCAITINREKLVEEIRAGFGLDKKEGSSIEVDELFTFYNVAYRNKDDLFMIPGVTNSLNTKLNKLLKGLKEKISKITPDKKEGKVGQLIMESLNNIAFLFKTSEYQYEHEVRLVIRNIDFLIKTIDENFTPPKVYIELTGILSAITKVTLGPKVDRPDEWAAAFNYTFKKKELEPEIIISRLPYK